MNRRVVTFLFLLFIVLAGVRTSYAQSELSSSPWQATVKPDSATLYAGVSDSSQVVATLKRGDTVIIGLEITSANRTWYSVTTTTQPPTSGYLNGTNLDVQPAPVAEWEYVP